MVWAWNLVCGRLINFSNGKNTLTLLTLVCPTDDYGDFCVWVDGQCDVIIIKGHTVCTAAVNEKRYWSSFYCFRCSHDGIAAWHLSPFCCFFLARRCILVSFLKIPLYKLAFLANLEIRLELELEYWSFLQIRLELELPSFRSNSSN